MKTVTLAASLCLALTSVSHAQERAAGGSLDTQMTWTVLSDLAKAAGAKADAVNTRVNQVVVCGKKGLVYAPGQTGADTEGCYESRTVSGVSMTTINKNLTTMSTTVAGHTTNINAIIGCNKAGKIYNGTTCIAPVSTKTTVNMDTCVQMSWKSFYGLCPANHVLAGAVTRNSDTGEWNSFYCCPLE